MPEFSQVVEIVLDENGTPYFALQKMPLPDYCRHYHAYAVEQCTDFNVFICKQSNFIDYHTYYTHQAFNALQQYIVLKYYIIGI